MTDQQLELELRAWFRAEVPAHEAAPAALHASVAGIPRTVVSPTIVVSRRRVGLLAVAALIAVFSSWLIVGPGLGPTPSPTPRPNGTPSSSAKEPTLQPTPTPFVTTGLLVVYQLTGTNAEIFTLDPTTLEKHHLTSAPFDDRMLQFGTAARVAWSNDHRLITVSYQTDGTFAAFQVDVASGAQLPIAALTERVSPDGRLLARRDDDIMISDQAGNLVRHLPLPNSVGLSDLGPWSPDGSALLMSGCRPCDFLGKGPDKTNRIHFYVVPADGSPDHELLQVVTTTTVYGDMAWSPDGSKITALQPGEGVVELEASTVNLLPARLTTGPGDYTPTWSPDGTRIAFNRSAGKGRGIWVIGFDGTGATRLTTAPADYTDRLPVWSPDGRTILFTRGAQDDFGDLWQVPSTGGTPALFLENAVAAW